MVSKTSFPNISQLAHLEELKRSDKLYDGEHADLFGIKEYFKDDTRKEERLYMVVNIPALITDYFADMLIGDGIIIDDSNDTINTAANEIVDRNQLDELAYELAQDQSKYGYAVVRVRKDGEKAVIEDVDPSSYFPTYDNRDTRHMSPARVVFASWIIDPQGKHKDDLIYKTIYEKTTLPGSSTPTITVSYDLRIAKADRTEGVSLSNDPYYVALYPEIKDAAVTLEWTDRIPVWEITNVKSRKNRLGKSDYKDVLSLISEINDRFTQVSIQLIKHLNAKMAVAEGSLSDEEGDEGVTRTHEMDFVEVAEGEITPQYIESKNPLIDVAMKFVDKLATFALSIAKVPPEILNIEGMSNGNMKVEGMRIRQYPTIRKIQRKQKTMRTVLMEVIKAALKLEGVSDVPSLSINFVDAMPSDEAQTVQNIVDRHVAGLISTQSAIERLDELSPEEALQEVERIKGEAPKIEPFQPITTA